MFKPRQMSRLFIAASKEQMEPVIQELYRHGVFHIEEFTDQAKTEYEGFKIGMPLAGASEVSSDLLIIRSLTAAYMVKPDEEDPNTRQRTSEIRSLIERDLPLIEKETEGLTTMRSRLETEEKDLEQRIASLEPFTKIPVDLDMLRGYESLAVFAGSVAHDVALEIPHERFYSPSKTGNFIVVIAPVECRSQVEKALNDAMFQQVQIPEETGPASVAISSYQVQIISVTEQIAANTAKLRENRKKYAGFLLACDELLTTDVSKAEAPLRFATTAQSFVAEGWVPVDEVAGLTDAINQVTKEKCYITEIPVDLEHDAVPVEYDNPTLSRPTQLDYGYLFKTKVHGDRSHNDYLLRVSAILRVNSWRCRIRIVTVSVKPGVASLHQEWGRCTTGESTHNFCNFNDCIRNFVFRTSRVQITVGTPDVLATHEYRDLTW